MAALTFAGGLPFLATQVSLTSTLSFTLIIGPFSTKGSSGVFQTFKYAYLDLNGVIWHWYRPSSSMLTGSICKFQSTAKKRKKRCPLEIVVRRYNTSNVLSSVTQRPHRRTEKSDDGFYSKGT